MTPKQHMWVLSFFMKELEHELEAFSPTVTVYSKYLFLKLMLLFDTEIKAHNLKVSQPAVIKLTCS
jgi:hypothetical protein